MENQNDQVFEADQEVNAYLHLPFSSSHKGRDTLKAAFGRFNSKQEAEDDRTPLLGGNRGQDQDGSSSPSNLTRDGEPTSAWEGERDFEGRPWWNKPSIFWLLPPFALFTMAFGGVIVPRLDLVISLICRQYFCDRSLHDPSFQFLPIMLGSDNPQCRIPEVQSLVSKFQLYGSLIAGILAAATSPLLGSLSDKYGRTKMISITTFGLLLNEVMTIIVATYPDMISVNWILLGFFFDGLGGSFIAAMALSYAYASDCTIPERRNVVFGYYHGSLFAGIAIGPILAGYLVKATGKLLAPFYVALSLHSAVFLFVLFVIPESLTKERQLAARQKKIYALDLETPGQGWLAALARTLKAGNLLAPLSALWPTGPGTNPAVRRNLVLIAGVDTTMFGVAMGALTVVLLYSKYMFGWDTFQTTIFVSVVNTCRVITLIIALPVITRLFRGPVESRAKGKNSGSDLIDLGIIRTAILFDFLGFVGYTLARTGPLFILSGAVASIGGMGSPTLQAALTKHAPPEKTGQVLGAMGLLHAIARIVAPIVFNLIYAKTVGGFTQTVFVSLAATFGVAFIMSWFIKPHVYWDQPTPHPSNETPNETAATDEERL